MPDIYFLNVYTTDRVMFCNTDPVLETIQEAIDDIIEMQARGFSHTHTARFSSGIFVNLPMLAMVREQMANNEAEAIHARGDLPAYRQAAR